MNEAIVSIEKSNARNSKLLPIDGEIYGIWLNCNCNITFIVVEWYFS